MKYFMIMALFFALNASVPAMADHVSADKGHEVATIGINGLVCDFCARAMEKTFGKRDAVEKISVNMDTKKVVLRFAVGKSIDDAEIKKAITEAGYDVTVIERKKA